MAAPAGIIGNPATMNIAGDFYRIAPGPRYAMLEVRVDQAKLDAWTARVRDIPGAMRRLMPAALNKTAAEAKTLLYREFLTRMHIARKASVRDRLTLTPKASATSWAAGVRIALTRFTVASFAGTQQTAYGVYWSPRTAGGGKIIPRTFLLARVKNYLSGKYIEGEQVFRRAQRGEKGFQSKGVNRAGHIVRETRAGGIVARYSIKIMRGPSLARTFSDDPQFQGDMDRKGGAILEKKVLSQVDRIAAGISK